jgi:hypothetical protein
VRSCAAERAEQEIRFDGKAGVRLASLVRQREPSRDDPAGAQPAGAKADT